MARRGYRYKRYYGKNRSKFMGPLLPGGYAKGNAKKLVKKWRNKQRRYKKKSYYGTRTSKLGYTAAKKWVNRADLYQYAKGGTARFRINYQANHVIDAANSYVAGFFNPHPRYPASGYGGIFSITSDTTTGDTRTMDHTGMLGSTTVDFAFIRPKWIKTVIIIKVRRQANCAAVVEAVAMRRLVSQLTFSSPRDLSYIESTQRDKMSFFKQNNQDGTMKFTMFSRLNYKMPPTNVLNIPGVVNQYLQRTSWFSHDISLADFANLVDYPVHQVIIKTGPGGIGAFSLGQSLSINVQTYHTVFCQISKNINNTEVFNNA
nr:MAG TPA: hypothetical protein [Circoviridae sp.]